MTKEETLKFLKFKKVWLSDKSGFWYEKNIKFLDFIIQFTYDLNQNFGDWALIHNKTKEYLDITDKLSFKKLINKLNKYDTFIKK